MTRNRAFTLPEVLATLVLVGIVLPVAFNGISVAMQTSARARHTAEATELAQQKLNELALTDDVTQLAAAGTFGDAWPEYRWQSECVTGDLGTYVVTVTVMWMERSAERSTSLSTLVYLPGSSATLEEEVPS